MYQGKTFLGIIPARGGSKGIAKKNIIDAAGKPLIAWTIESAKESKYLDKLILSSDDDEIITISKQWGCEVPFKRPKELALDDTLAIAVVRHAIEQIPEYDYIVFLQPTSPMRSAKDIDQCIEKCIDNSSKSAVSITENQKSPYWMYTLEKDDQMVPVLRDSVRNYARRQDLTDTYALNGAVYVAEKEWLKKAEGLFGEGTLGYIMPKERSLDIDTHLDLTIFEFYKKSLKDKF